MLSWEMVSQLPSGGFYPGGKGGFLNAIVGSLYIVGGSTLLGLLISLPVVFYMNVYLKPNSKFGYIARRLMIPSSEFRASSMVPLPLR